MEKEKDQFKSKINQSWYLHIDFMNIRIPLLPFPLWNSLDGFYLTPIFHHDVFTMLGCHHLHSVKPSFRPIKIS